MQVTPSLEESPAGKGHRPDWSSFLSLGFRPFYLAGTAWAAVSVALWIFTPHWLRPPLAGVAWHAHEMLWGFVATIAAGFLLTAGASWTGINPLRGGALAVALALWLLARAAFLFGGETAFTVGAAAELALFALAATALASAIVRSRNLRNAAVPALLLALGAADAAFLLAVHGGDVGAAMGWAQAGVWLMALVALLIARRVIPFFAMRAVAGLAIPTHVRSGQAQLAAVVLAIAASLAAASTVAALALAAAGVAALWQLVAWRPAAVRRQPILWILYVGYAGLGLGLIAAAAQLAGLIDRATVPTHVIALLGFSVLIIGMLTRTALGHLGRPLALDRSMVAAYLLVIAAAVLRLAALPGGAWSHWLLIGSALAWIAAFGLYLWRFAPWLVRPRADGRPS